jgi:non-heme chloroperoxidase
MVHFAATAVEPVTSDASVRLANGVRLHYARQGPAYGRAIVFLHGYSDSSFSFSRVMPLLPPELRVIAPDLRGHGHSDRPATGYRVPDFAADVIAMMDALEVPEAVIVGHSIGSFVAQAIAERVPRRVNRLVLLGSASRVEGPGMEDFRKEVDALSDPVDAAFVHAFQHNTIALPVPPAFMAAAIANSRRMPAHIWKKVLQGVMDYRPALPRPYVRTLVLGGDCDAVFPVAEQTRLAREFSNVELRIIEGVGHALHWEQPRLFVDELLRFLR